MAVAVRSWSFPDETRTFFSVIQSLNDGKQISTKSRTRQLGQIYDMAISEFLGAMRDDGVNYTMSGESALAGLGR
jgi:hypothetical protein